MFRVSNAAFSVDFNNNKIIILHFTVVQPSHRIHKKVVFADAVEFGVQTRKKIEKGMRVQRWTVNGKDNKTRRFLFVWYYITLYTL